MIKEVAEYYVQRLGSIYRTKPKAAATIALLAKQMLADNLASTFNEGFDLDLAVGKQLDTIGKYIGVDRDVQVPDTRPYFGFVRVGYPSGTQNLNGFRTVASLAVNSTGVWNSVAFANYSVSQLTDYSYRQLMRLKVFVNSSNNTLAEAVGLASLFFPGQLRLKDNQNMSLVYYYGRGFQLPPSVLAKSFLRPMGVGLTVKPLAAWDAFLDMVPVFNSETASGGVLDFGTGGPVLLGTLTIKNITDTPFTVVTVIVFPVPGSVWVAEDPSIDFPATLNNGESIDIPLRGTSYVSGEHTAQMALVLSSESGNSTPIITLKGVFGTSMPFSSGFSNGFVNN